MKIGTWPGWRIFVAGLVCGTMLGATVVLLWPKPESFLARFDNDPGDWEPVLRDGKPVVYDPTYDKCLVGSGGNKVACDALMRLIQHARGQNVEP
jgi:hypothetical protein